MRWSIPNVTLKWKYSEHSCRVSNPHPQCGRADSVGHCTLCFVTPYNCIVLPINAAVVVDSQKGGKIFFCLLSQANFSTTSCQLTIKNRRQLICCLKMPCSYGTRRLQFPSSQDSSVGPYRERSGTHCIGGGLSLQACLNGHGKSRLYWDSVPGPWSR